MADNGLMFSLENLESVKRDFNHLTTETVKKVIDIGVASILDIQTTAKRPGYVPYKTGTLKRSITSQVILRKSGDDITLGSVGSNLSYARIQEYGGMAGRGHKSKIVGKFYITRAVNDSVDKIRRRFEAIKLLGR